jgi:TrmH family RNA methyltransferase
VIDNPRSPRVRAVAKLAKRSAREETGYFLVEGPQAVAEAFAYRPELAIDLFITRAAFDRLGDFGAAGVGIEPELVTTPVLEAMSDTVTPQGVVAVFAHHDQSVDSLLDRAPRLLAILDETRDPGNAGTIIRAADAAGADGVILTGKHVDLFNPKVVRSTTGSLFHLPIAQNSPLDAAVGAVREAGLQVLAADVDGDELPGIWELLSRPTAWLFGNEARGLADEALALADRVVRLPIYGHAESLNLATAASVCLYASAFAQRAGAGTPRG